MAKSPVTTTDQQLMAALDANNARDDQQDAALKANSDADAARDQQNKARDDGQDAKLAALQAQLDALKAQQPPQPAPEPEPQPTDPTRLVDPAGNVWTLGPNGETLKNGADFAHGTGSEYRLVNGAVQVLGTDGNWWQAGEGGWSKASTDPAPDPAPQPDPQPEPTQPPVNTALTRSRIGSIPEPNRTPADLVAEKLVLPYSASVAMNAGALPNYIYAGTFDSVGLTKYMGATGERQEIGLVTEAQADWLSGGSPDNMLAQAEAHGSVPVHALIEGRIIDVLKYPQANFFYRSAQTGWKPYFDITKESIQPDTAHYPSLSYVPFMATLDPYYLEELQFAATFHICGLDPNYAQGKGILWPWQQRQVAWGLRDIIAAYIATMEAEKAGVLTAICQPSSYWKTILDNNIAFHMDRYVTGTGKFEGQPKGDNLALAQEMGFIGCDDMLWLTPWQQDYISIVLGWAVWTGKVPQIRPLYDFQIRQAVNRATGPLRSCAIQYNVPKGAGSTWAETLAMNGYAPTADDHYPDSVSNNPDYLGYLRGALRVAVMNGVPGAEEAFTYAEAEARRKSFITRRWAVA